MSHHQLSRPTTCLSDVSHDGRISDPALHHSGCLPYSSRSVFLASLPDEAQRRIRQREEKIRQARKKLETVRTDSNAALHLRGFRAVLSKWRVGRPRRAMGVGSIEADGDDPWKAHDGREDEYFPVDHGVEADIEASVIVFKSGKPRDVPNLQGHFPNQTIPIRNLLNDTEDNIIRRIPSGEDDTVRYFHLPYNNMAWIEAAIARYYGDPLPSHDNHSLHDPRPLTRTEMLLRTEFWQGQRNFDHGSPVHARHMRPFCSGVSVDTCAGEEAKGNTVLFMPYLHWETDRGRMKVAECIKQAGRREFMSVGEIVDRAAQRERDAEEEGTHGLAHHLHRHHHHHHHVTGPLPHRTTMSSSGGGVLSSANSVCHDKENRGSTPLPTNRRELLGQLLRRAALVAESLDFDVEERLTYKYLHSSPPLHPRRTLDQSYYGALRSTGTRDRDQVVYRGTTPEAHDCVGFGACQTCKEDVRRVPRVLMVDQLWMWILDEKTIITSFPQRWSTFTPDPSAVHLSLRHRLSTLPPPSSAYDLALLITDECSRVFFDRTRGTSSRQPNLVELFADAIRGTTYKQTAAFDQFLIYTHLASREYGRVNGGKTDVAASKSTQNTLLNINSEGNLLKEVKDIIDEIHIMMRVKQQQRVVMEAFVKNLRVVLMPKVRRVEEGTGFTALEAEIGIGMATDEMSGRERRRALRTLARADQLLEDAQGRMYELQTLLENAMMTSAALKDLLTLKQQQAGVIEAREAVKQASETLNQGQSIMVFTVFTIIFLPLSFIATVFGMNSAEFADGAMSLKQQFSLMFPISAAIILTSTLLAFSSSIFTNAPATLIRSAFSFAYNYATTWLLVRSGAYMVGRDMGAAAGRLREREVRLTGAMKAEVMRKRGNLEKMRAAGVVGGLTVGGGMGEGVSGRTTGIMDDGGQGPGRITPGRMTPAPFSPYVPSPGFPRPGFGSADDGLRGSQGRRQGEGAGAAGPGSSQLDVEMDDWRAPSSGSRVDLIR